MFAYFFLIQAALPHLCRGASIINTASITAYKGNTQLIDYSSTKGAVVSLTRVLAQSLAAQGIRVNSVAPGPIWTPLIPASFSAEDVQVFGTDTPMGRAGQPSEKCQHFRTRLRMHLLYQRILWWGEANATGQVTWAADLPFAQWAQQSINSIVAIVLLSLKPTGHITHSATCAVLT